MKSYSKKLRAQPLYTIIATFFLLALQLFILAIPTISSWEIDLSITTFLFYGLFGVSAVATAVNALSTLQYAELREDMLMIKNPFKKIKLRWEAITCIEHCSLLTHNSRGAVYYNWLVIKTDTGQTIENAVGKRFWNAPYLIIATPPNLDAIKENAEKYPHIIWSDKIKRINTKQKGPRENV